MAIIQEINSRFEELNKELSQIEFNIKAVYRGKALGPTGAEAQMYDDQLDHFEELKAGVLEEIGRLEEAKQALEGNPHMENDRGGDTNEIEAEVEGDTPELGH